MKSLITGIGGFVGPHLANHLKERGHEVFGIERSASADKNIFQCDILDRPKVFEVFSKVKPDYVFHLAATSSVSESSKDTHFTMKVNVDGTKNILDAAKEVSKAVLVVSTAHVYGIPREIPISEANPLNPVSAYGQSRMEQEKLALKYKDDLKIVVSRSFNHTGPGQPPGFMCSDFAKQIASIENGAEPVMKVGNLEARRDFTDVRDTVKAYLLALEKCESGGVYNVCSGKAYMAREILDMLLSMTDKKVKVIENNEQKKGDIPILIGNNMKFMMASGWRPTISFNQTLKDVLNYWRENSKKA